MCSVLLGCIRKGEDNDKIPPMLTRVSFFNSIENTFQNVHFLKLKGVLAVSIVYFCYDTINTSCIGKA